MSLLIVDSFDNYGSGDTNFRSVCDGWYSGYGPSISTGGGRLGSAAIYNEYSGGYWYYNLNSAKSTLYIGIAFRAIGGSYEPGDGSSDNRNFCHFWYGSYHQLTINPGLNYSISVSNYNTGAISEGATVIARSNNYLWTANVWYHLQIAVNFHVSTGWVIVKLNDEEVLNETGLRTVSNGGGVNLVDRIAFFGVPSSGGTNPMPTYHDDLYVDDAQLHGDCHIVSLMPNGDGTLGDFTPLNAGDHYVEVDENIITSDDYVYAASLNSQESFTFLCPSNISGIKAVVLNSCATLDDTGTSKIKALIRSGGSVYLGSIEFSLDTTSYWKTRQTIFETDPDDSNPWTYTKINAAEFGIEITGV